MPTISLIATDLDGTLFHDRENIADADRAALIRLANAGIHIVLATGRELDAVTPALDRLGLWPYVHDIIPSGGAFLYHVARQETEVIGVMQPDILCAIFDRYAPYGMPLVLPADGTLYTNLATDRLRHESELLRSPLVELPDLKQVLRQPRSKLVFNGSEEQIETLLPLLKADPDPRFEACRSHDNYIDCYAAGINKGAALTRLCDQLHIPLAQTAAIGDNHNDLELLATAGYAGCPGDGTADARAAADYVCCPAHAGAFADFCGWLGL